MNRRPTLEDVAARAGVSRALVSIVMRDAPGASDHTRERVKRAADELGYRPDPRARRLRQRRSNLIGLTFAVGQAFHADLVDGVYASAEALGYDVVLSAVTPHRDEMRAVRTLVDDRCEGLILIGPRMRAGRLGDLASGMPVVVMARRVRAVDAVRSDDVAGAVAGVEHLLGLGHRRILYLDGGGAPGAAERLRGYRRATGDAGLPEVVRPGGLTEREGAAAAAAMLETGDLPDAVFAFNDRCALGVMDVLIRAGVTVPQQISLLGFDDSPLAGLAHIQLSTIRQDAAALADAAVSRLVSRLDGDGAGSAPTDIVRTPTLVVRGSTAARKA
ncbi:LacI family DNA-binding transcriptional regulator [Mycolicibacterium iranicum]|uniref:LacI family DNA-binding transcriptional regulator n=1 Tax=Mycolicibacterium iranicum TaxID=912594 RepID=A0A1X1WEV0_MYCIR|nr:LacI family DNA-binding transcriptional regulator [Mycolicibacterium iranicum]MCZ0729922.1 LacI family DNA-binding transcriptional regulator [Mycolicibacterium iranicum]ORV85116.1 LacI family transcriptional regulator [Mycolicibacterium iranicum]